MQAWCRKAFLQMPGYEVGYGVAGGVWWVVVLQCDDAVRRTNGQRGAMVMTAYISLKRHVNCSLSIGPRVGTICPCLQGTVDDVCAALLADPRIAPLLDHR